MSKTIKIKFYFEKRDVSIYNLLIDNINKRYRTFIIPKIIENIYIITESDYCILNIIDKYFDDIIKIYEPSDKIEFVYQYITNLYIGIEKKLLLFIDMCKFITQVDDEIYGIQFLNDVIKAHISQNNIFMMFKYIYIKYTGYEYMLEI